MKIVLGSKSARRSELLSLIGYDFYVDFVDIDETIHDYKNPKDYVQKVVQRKGVAVYNKHENELIICADTIVVIDDIILNKPKDTNDAKLMIKLINNRAHSVMTAVYIKYLNYEKTFVEETIVYIDNISEEEIEDYISTNEPYDKAGGYAIQGKFAKHIKKIDGDFYNVMGLPINRLNNEIKEIELTRTKKNG
ncbi:MAG: Maf family protein [Bacilli bacterium]|nr:Maf family protein [Bacilli bacterium]